ncbi:MAG: hypothetical protein M3511_10840 [Deinococcota bacterium]|jgi:hypothetical protein|nr:hypothetical protein [Deinococcota bacterium]
MQRTKEELEGMTHADLVARVLEMQDMLCEGLVVRDALHRVLNDLLKAKAAEVGSYAGVADEELTEEELAVKRAWAKARHAVSNPPGVARLMLEDGG